MGARLTMAVAWLIMQDWIDMYDVILENSEIEEILSGLCINDEKFSRGYFILENNLMKKEQIYN